MKQEYQLSRGIIVIFTIIISSIIFINEDNSFKLVGTSMFTGIALIASYIGTRASRKMIQIGDKISNIVFRFLYYIFLLFLILALAFVFYLFILLIYEAKPRPNDWGVALGEAILSVFAAASFFVFLLIPYIQTLIVLFLRKIR